MSGEKGKTRLGRKVQTREEKGEERVIKEERKHRPGERGRGHSTE